MLTVQVPVIAVVRHPDGREATVSTRDLAPTGVDLREETSNDLVPTGSEVHLGEWESTSSETMPRQPPSDSVQSPAQKSTTNSQGMNCKRHFIGVRRAPNAHLNA